MAAKTYTPNAPFQKTSEACKITGLSMHYLRNGVRSGTIPHIKSGKDIYINVPALLKQLGADIGGE